MLRATLFLILGTLTLSAAAAGNGNNQPGNNVWDQIESLQAQINALGPAPGSVSVTVDCDAGETITNALETSATELEITYSGTCSEAVSISRRDVTVTGTPGSVIDGSVTAETGALVTLIDVSIINAARSGLQVDYASVKAVRLNVSNAAENGILVVRGSLTCGDCSATNNGIDGLLVTINGSAIIGGAMDLSNNGAEGIEAGYASAIATIPDATLTGAANATSHIEVVGNGGFGILGYGGGSFSASTDDAIMVSQNTFGALAGTGGSLHLAGDWEISGSNSFGLSALGGAIFVGGEAIVTGNGLGIFLSDNGTLRGTGAIDATGNNGLGVMVRASYLGGVALTANGGVSLGLFQLGATVNLPFANVTGNINCDGTEIVSGTINCGAN